MPGVSCPNCINQHSAEQKQRYLEREKQNQLAQARGEKHIGGEVAHIIQQRRLLKKAHLKQVANSGK